MNARQRALTSLANATRRPACVDDQRVNHGISFDLFLPFGGDQPSKSIRTIAAFREALGLEPRPSRL
jgi:hypothetical protein